MAQPHRRSWAPPKEQELSHASTRSKSGNEEDAADSKVNKSKVGGPADRKSDRPGDKAASHTTIMIKASDVAMQTSSFTYAYINQQRKNQKQFLQSIALTLPEHEIAEVKKTLDVREKAVLSAQSTLCAALIQYEEHDKNITQNLLDFARSKRAFSSAPQGKVSTVRSDLTVESQKTATKRVNPSDNGHSQEKQPNAGQSPKKRWKSAENTSDASRLASQVGSLQVGKTGNVRTKAPKQEFDAGNISHDLRFNAAGFDESTQLEQAGISTEQSPPKQREVSSFLYLTGKTDTASAGLEVGVDSPDVEQQLHESSPSNDNILADVLNNIESLKSPESCFDLPLLPIDEHRRHTTDTSHHKDSVEVNIESLFGSSLKPQNFPPGTRFVAMPKLPQDASKSQAATTVHPGGQGSAADVLTSQENIVSSSIPDIRAGQSEGNTAEALKSREVLSGLSQYDPTPLPMPKTVHQDDSGGVLYELPPYTWSPPDDAVSGLPETEHELSVTTRAASVSEKRVGQDNVASFALQTGRVLSDENITYQRQIPPSSTVAIRSSSTLSQTKPRQLQTPLGSTTTLRTSSALSQTKRIQREEIESSSVQETEVVHPDQGCSTQTTYPDPSNVDRRQPDDRLRRVDRALDCPFEGCTSSYIISDSLRNHIFDKHIAGRAAIRWLCPFVDCSYMCGTNVDFLAHVMRHFPQRPIATGFGSGQPRYEAFIPRNNPNICRTCGEYIGTGLALRLHMRQLHGAKTPPKSLPKSNEEL